MNIIEKAEENVAQLPRFCCHKIFVVETKLLRHEQSPRKGYRKLATTENIGTSGKEDMEWKQRK